jgi:hypothetical protein
MRWEPVKAHYLDDAYLRGYICMLSQPLRDRSIEQASHLVGLFALYIVQ